MKKRLFLLFLIQGLIASSAAVAQENSASGYRPELNIVYSTVDGKELKLNAFLPENAINPTPAIVEIHGGWLFGGEAASKVDGMGGWQIFTRHGLAIFSIQYRLGEQGGIPQCIRDCRNAIRFIRQNAKRFNIDPNRIDVTGGSAGGYLSLMAAMVPDDFPDGGPTSGLEGVSAKVSGSFSFIPPTDFVRFWNEGPEDVITNADGKISFRTPDNKIPNDSRPHLRVLFHGVIPDTDEHKALYTLMCPIGHVRKDVPPLLICDGEKDPIVPGLEGKELYEKLVSVGADATYWMTPKGGHAFPGGAGFEKVLDDFIVHSLKKAEATNAPVLPPGANSAAFPAPHTGAGPEKDGQNKMDRFGKKHFDIIFDGDSIMNRWETTGKEIWNQRYAGIAADFGIEGDHVENVLWRLDHGQVDGIDPKVIVLMIGTNNSGHNSADEIAAGIKDLVAEYEKRCPNAHIILMGIFPRGEKPTDGGRRKVAAVNSQIKALDDGQRVTFIDISTPMIEPDGTISRDMMPDFVHPTAKGYQIWADAIQPVINKYVPAK